MTADYVGTRQQAHYRVWYSAIGF